MPQRLALLHRCSGMHSDGDKNKRSSSYDPDAEKSRLLTALDRARNLCTKLEGVGLRTKATRCCKKIKVTIDDYAECEIEHPEYLRSPMRILPPADGRRLRPDDNSGWFAVIRAH